MLGPGLTRVPVKARASAPEGGAGDRVAAFFSGGVDSFYAALTRREEISDLIFLHGFDISLDQADARRRVSTAVREVAAELGKNLIEVETDYRAHLDPSRHSDWPSGVDHRILS